MSTRALYSVFEDSQQPINIYIHSDGYPSGAAEHIREALIFAWALPRFEADEFAAALCTGVKSHYLQRYAEALEKQISGEPNDDFHSAKNMKEYATKYAGGGARIFSPGPPIEADACDLEYRYEIRLLNDKLHIKCLSTRYWDEPRTETERFAGSFDEFDAWASTNAEAEG